MADVFDKSIQVNTAIKREATFLPETLNEEERTVELSFSSESAILTQQDNEEIKRLIGTDTFYEVLGHGTEEADFSRLNESGPLLFNHSATDHIGTIVKAWTDGGKGRARVKFSRSALGESKMRDVQDGILKSVSVSGTVRAYRETEERDGIPVLRAVSWTANEISLVPMPADVSVGVGRAHKQITQRSTMPDNTDNKNKDQHQDQPPKVDIEAETKRALDADRKRIADIHEAVSYCTTERNLDVPSGTVNKAINDGWGKDQTISHIFLNQPESKRGADTKVLDDMERQEKRGFSVCRAISGSMSRDGITGFEAEVMQEITRKTGQRSESGGLLIPLAALSTQRSMLAGVFNQGGSTIPVDTGPMIPKLDPMPVLERAGATMLRGLTAPTNFPRHTTAAVAEWVAEAQEVSKSTPGTDDVMLTPHGLAAYVEIGRELAKTSSIDIEAFVRNEILRRINLGIDKAGLVGSGVSGTPKGLFSLAASALNVVTFGDPPTWGKIVQFEGDIEDQDGLEGSISWITSAPVKAAWKSTAKDSGSGLFLATETNTANGYPIYVTSQLKGTTGEDRVLFGNFAQLLIGMYGAIELFVDQSAALQRRGLIGITGLAHADVAVRQGKAFARSADKGNQ